MKCFWDFDMLCSVTRYYISSKSVISNIVLGAHIHLETTLDIFTLKNVSFKPQTNEKFAIKGK